MGEVWLGCVDAIHIALASAGISAKDILSIGVTAHGDGVYLLDNDGEPVRPGILSLDSRAWEVLQAWKSSPIMAEALKLTGQYPHQAAPAPLLNWIKNHEPQNYTQIRHILACKDWIRFKLTGQIATDPTEASTSFTNVLTQKYSPEAFSLFGLDEIKNRVPVILSSMELAGTITHQAAQITGLREGTPIATGLHDVDAGALGAGCIHPGQLSATTGTYSINQVISSQPFLDEHWACRNFIFPGQWMCMSISPASTTNLEWFVRELCPLEVELAKGRNISRFDFVNQEIQSVLDDESRVFFLPFIYGSPHGENASAAFLGIRGWHTRAHLLKAIFEGVVFNHKTHIDYLRSMFPTSEIRLAGGGTKSEVWSQMFADALNMKVVITESEEPGTLGTAMCAGVASGVYSSLDQAVERTVRIKHTYLPDRQSNCRLTNVYEMYAEIINSLGPVWDKMENSGQVND
jgi:L-xylulokinase